jgi:carbon starvation protein
VIALAVVTTGLVNSGRGRYAPVTLLPLLFVATTTSTAGYYEITGKFWDMIKAGEVVRGWLNIGLTLMLLACVAVILATAVLRWIRGGEKQAADTGNEFPMPAGFVD